MRVAICMHAKLHGINFRTISGLSVLAGSRQPGYDAAPITRLCRDPAVCCQSFLATLSSLVLDEPRTKAITTSFALDSQNGAALFCFWH